MDPQRRIVITDATTAITVCSAGVLANTFTLRLFGLLGKRGIHPDSGLLIKPSTGVHTFGMRFPIDIVSLDRQNRVLSLWEKVGPWRIRGVHPKTKSIRELAAGKIRQCAIEPGDQLVIETLL
jgi:uncharacterized membrane protein (UPF0127 family)